MKELKRILSLVLCCAMLLSVIPALPVQAAGDTIYVLAGGDFQEAGDHANSAANVTNILAQISQKYTTMDGFLFIGDYDCETHDSATETANGITALMGAVQGTYSNLNDANAVLVQGNHDYMDSRIDATGGHDFDGYSVYVLNEDDYPNGGGNQSGVLTLANNLENWLNKKIGEAYSAPIFITSHLPLAFTPRTVTQGDAKYAKYIFDVLNAAAEEGLNIIFLHGHDHAYGPDNYMGGEAIYLAEGDKICIAEAGSTSAWTEETLNFTYMNAGYTGYYSDAYTYVTTAGTDKLTMTVFAITDNKVTVERYSEDGLYNLKSAGYNGSYSNTSVDNVSLGLPMYSNVYASPQTIILNEITTDIPASTIGQYVGIAAENPADDVTTANNGWVEIVAPIPGTFTEDVETSGSDWVTLEEPTGGTTTYAYTQVDSISSNGEYVIVDNDYAVALMDDDGTMVGQSVNIEGTVLTSEVLLTEWQFPGTTSGTVYDGSYYFRYYNNSFSLTNEYWYRSTVYFYDQGSYFEISGSNNSNRGYSLYYDGSKWTTSGRNQNQNQYVRLFARNENGDVTTGGTGLFAYLKGDLSYTITAGMTAEQAKAMVMDGIDIQYATKEDHSDEQTYQDDGVGMSWTLDPAYDPNVPGDYAVTIAYNGQTIGVVEVIVPAKDDINGQYSKITGGLSYEVTPGTSPEDALAAVMAGIDGYTYEDMATPGTDVEGTKLDDSALTWSLDSNYNGNIPGDYAVTISYGDKILGTAEVVVPPSTTYYIAEGDGLYIVDMNTTADDALDAVKAGVTVSSATDINGTNKTAIDDSLVTWNWVDKYDGTNYGPYTVEVLYDGHSLGTVEVKVDVHYDEALNPDWTYVGESEASDGTHTYTLDTDGIDSDGQYIIVAESQELALHTSGSSVATAVSVDISDDGKTLTTDTRDYEYYWNTTYGFTRDGYNGLYQSSWNIYLGTKDASYLDGVVNHNNGTYTLYDNEGNERGLYYNGSSWTVNNSGTTTDYKVRLYKYTNTTGGTEAGPIYAKLEGNTVYTVNKGKSSIAAMNAVKAGITGYISSSADGSNPTELDDGKLTWTWKNTYNANSVGSYWVEISYEGKVLGTVEVRVEEGVINHYPEYPNEGAVKVNKTATGLDFQSSGVVRVELSASGIPVKKGADLIVMLDTSSSMTSHTVTGTSKTRAQVLEESLVNLIAQLKTPGDDGELLDIRVAIADFNGFYGESHSESGTPYDRDAADMMSDDISYNADSEAKVYTGDGSLGTGAFVDAANLAESYTLNYTSGTNYDYAMDAIYQLGTAIKDTYATPDERDLFVIFMSDGAAMQWNYYHSQGGSELWNNWITGAWTADDLTTANLNCTTHTYYYDEVDHNGDGMYNEHRMANAIKGDPASNYEVIRKTNTLGTPTGETNMYMVPGLGATMFSISFDAQADNKVTMESMDKSIESLASEDSGTATYYYKVTTADELDTAFNAIGAEVAYAATNARFVDQLGNSFTLQMKPVSYKLPGASETSSITPKIEVLNYEIYTKAEADAVPEGTAGDTVTNSMIGDRKGDPSVLETVLFNADGTEAYSDKIYTTDTDGNKTPSNILINGVICAKTFWYNTTNKTVKIDKDGDGNGDFDLGPETFYWEMGTINTTELALRYNVYLEGSMEGTREAGSYQTNNDAILYYTNYLDADAKKPVASPTVAWKAATVSYAFYLVNEKGEIIVNQTTGQTGSFANKIAVTNPVVYDTILLNSEREVTASIAALDKGVLPKYYTIYDQAAAYTIKVNSNATGNWTITQGQNVAATTYVTQFNPVDASAYSSALTENGISYDYTHTIVWFAVVWSIQANPDTVVIDYGLPVDISVLANDMFGDYGKLAAVGPYSPALEENFTAELADGFATTYEGEYGTATMGVATADAAGSDAAANKIRYTPRNMEMNGYERFSYAVQYTGASNPGYYYDCVTVIPAATIYYEDSFLTYTASNTEWTDEVEDTADPNATQQEDRPGFYSLTDANNIYGYDPVNNGMSMYSLGHAKKVHVNASSYATASFTFWGTGFDVISMTTNDTGTLLVEVQNLDTKEYVARYAVDTYYGYTCDLYHVTYTWTKSVWNGTYGWEKTIGDKAAEGTDPVEPTFPDNPAENDTVDAVEYCWILDPTNGKAIYQVPVMQIEQLPYGHYQATITATYADVFDHKPDDGYDLYLDAIRIYDPANNGAADGDDDTTIEDAYVADQEGWPSYLELRNEIIEAKTFGNNKTDTVVTGIVFIDGDSEVGDNQLTDYVNYGPNNEIYLAPGQRVAFILAVPQNIADVHIGIRCTDGDTATYTITNIALTNTGDTIKQGDYYGAKTNTLSTTTDMYYSLDDWNYRDIIVISNTGNRAENATTGGISLTNIKFTYTSEPAVLADTVSNDANSVQTVNGTQEEVTYDLGYVYMTGEAVALTLQALNTMEEEPVPEPQPATFEPRYMLVKLSSDRVVAGNKILVTVLTGADVENLAVNGQLVTRCTYSRWTNTKIWIIEIPADTVGTMEISVVAYNAHGEWSEPVLRTVTVRDPQTGPGEDWREWIYH